MNFEIIPASALSLSEQVRMVNAAFAGYIAGWTALDADSLAHFLCLQGADLSHSRFLRTADGGAGFGYINRIAKIPRLATMGLEPTARGTGAAAHLLEHLLGEAKQRGDAAMVLEVIEQNPRALACYRRAGFRELARLTGWRMTGAPVRAARDFAIEEIQTSEALKLASGRDYPELPWAIARSAAVKIAAPRAFRAGDAGIIVSDAAASPLRVHSFLCAEWDWGILRNLLAATLQRFPDREFFTPPVFPDDFGREIFEPLGFQPEPLTQFLMRCEL